VKNFAADVIAGFPTAASRFPYLPAYLPFTRLKNGTVHDW
jgi:hypothetical protein